MPLVCQQEANWAMRPQDGQSMLRFSDLARTHCWLLVRKIRDEVQNHPNQATDLSAILSDMCKTGEDINDWSVRVRTSKQLVDRLLTFLRELSPQKPAQNLLQEMEALQAANARLKQGSSVADPSLLQPLRRHPQHPLRRSRPVRLASGAGPTIQA